MPRPLRCLLLGEELLVSRCAEVLRERGHTIAGIVTRSPAVRRWAEDAGVPVVERAEYPGVLEREPVDVLLSITHPALIAPEVIRKARLAAVNYHDGPLPRYAGMNGSAWAILNGEASHALVWHHITAGLDEGDILERRDYALDPRETSVSLNVKNAALALESFQAVVHRLETGKLEGTPQRTDVERLVFSRHDRPAALAILDFARPAAELDRIVRACDFGPYANRFGAAKVLHGDRAVIVRESAVTDEHGTPGTVLGVGASGIDIATGAGCLRVLRATTLAGKALTLEEAASLLGIAPGTVLDGARRAACAPLSRALAEVEPASVAALSRRAPLQLSLDGITDSVSAVP
ncbi:MAG TPA: formyltransferase family protein, partial [Polyangiaceae bacterium]|nr:formyltransferase family protein [Polyangiaceae bacterium]